MRIVIAGAGEVGTHLAQMLANEEQDIVLMDADEKRLEEKKSHIEALMTVGDPVILDDLKEARVDGADLFVSVTPDGATNLLACSLAKMLGAKQTIARVNTHHHLEPKYADHYGAIGVDHLIYPEELAANEIASTTLNPWARQYLELFNGALILAGVKVRDNAEIVGKYLHELKQESSAGSDKFYHIVAIKRDLQTIIPSGSTRIEANDLVFFTCPVGQIDEIRRLAGKQCPKVRKMVIMGASRVAMQTIKKLPESIHICVIEKNKDKCIMVSDHKFPNVMVYHGDGQNPDLLREVGLDDAQVFVALTQNSETNILACLAAKRYNVYKTIAKEENIDYIPLAYRLDIGTLINKKLLAAGYIYRMLLGQRAGSIVCLSLLNNAEVAELIVGRQSPLVGKRIKDLDLPDHMTLGGMLRNGVPRMVGGDTVIEAYDHVMVFYHDVSLNELKRLFN
ncbi:MAG: Trk system potassium transporter TrkA [Porphyromonadaceae bacterium]|nr:Trk system potassium transporter TrkA [Porphyromonadaceae bacterium]